MRVEFVQIPAGLSKNWRQSLKGKRLIGWIQATYWCRVHDNLERIRIPVITKKKGSGRVQIHFIQKNKGRVYSRSTVHPLVREEAMKRLVDTMYLELRHQTSTNGELSVYFVEKNGKILHSVERD